MLAGKLFQRVAAALANVRSPNVAVLVLGTVNVMVDSDRSGPIIDPCGTRQDIGWKCDFTQSNKTYCLLLDK